jgi:tetratricopeptide (TPR) repeat protein
MKRLLIVAMVLGLAGGAVWAEPQKFTALASLSAMTPAQVEAEVMKLLSAGKQSDAEAVVKSNIDRLKENQRMVFLLAALARSRFAVGEAVPIFQYVSKMGTNTVEGACAYEVVQLDLKKDVGRHFMALQELVRSHPDDIMVRWMLAVQCRSLGLNEEGIVHYKKILETWNPGPVLVHQTYGNLLDQLKRYDEALVERRIAVTLEPAGWSYQGLGNTFAAMGSNAFSAAAFSEAVKFEPHEARYWEAWGRVLMRMEQVDEAIVKCNKALALDPDYWVAWSTYGSCMEKQGKWEDAEKAYKRAVAINPNDVYTQGRLDSMRPNPEDVKTFGAILTCSECKKQMSVAFFPQIDSVGMGVCRTCSRKIDSARLNAQPESD